MRFQERDSRILKTIHDYDGVLAKRQLKAMFWPDATWRAMEMRLSLLYHQGYLDWPNTLQWRTHPIPEPVCWLGWKGALWLANQSGLEISLIAAPNETKLRHLNSELRKQGLRWVREPRWNQLQHDLAIVDFRLAVEKSVREIPHLELEKWVTEGEFLVNTDTIEFQIETKGQRPKLVKRGVRPDGYFVLLDKRRLEQGLPALARFLVEIDMATHDLNSFLTEKAISGCEYVRSQAYKKRFGDNSGCWLVTTTTDARRHNLSHYIANALKKDDAAFLLATIPDLQEGNVLSKAIWWPAGKSRPISLV
jgi:hypothetical protein